MAFYSTQRVTSDGTLVLLPISIEYFDRSEITVFFDDILGEEGVAWNWVGSTDKTISFPTAVDDGVEVKVVRTTDIALIRHVFSDGAAFLDETMDENFRQILHIAQEARERASIADMFSNLNMHGYKISNVGLAVDPNDVISLAQYQADAEGAWAARNQAVAAKDAAVAAKVAAELSETNAETAEFNAETAQAASEAARNLSQTYASNSLASANASQTSRLAAETAETNAEVAELGAEAAQVAAESARDLAFEYAGAINPTTLVRIGDSVGELSFNQAGSGAVTRDAESKLREFVSRADYDSDASYNAARAALAGRADHRVRTENGTYDRLLSAKLGDVISVKDFGAVGDNVHRPLSSVNSFNDVNTTGWTVAQWQTIFPHVTSLTNTLDWAGIQAAINFASTPYKRAAVFLPAGYYVNTDPIQIPSFLTIYGDADNGTIINNQSVVYTGAQAVNQDPAGFLFVNMRNIVFRGGRVGLAIDVTGETAGNRFENVTWELQTDFNVNVNKLLQTTSFINCNFADAQYGLFVGAWTSNANNFVNCSFTNHAWSSVYMRSSEVNNFIGCRFEGGGVQGRATIDLTDSRNFNLIGCYFEATHEIAVGETGSCNSIWIDGCHFTGAVRAGQSGWFPYRFNSDGVIQFGNNNWGVISSNGPTKMFAAGVNSPVLPGAAGGTAKQLGNTGTQTVYFAHSKHHKHIVSPWVAPTSASWTKDLVVFKKENTDGSVPNMRALTGKLTISYYGLTGGGFEQRFVREYMVFVRSAGFSNMGASITMGPNDSAGAGTLTVQQKAGASSVALTVEAVFSGLDYGIGGMLQWSFEYITSSKTDADYIEASLA